MNIKIINKEDIEKIYPESPFALEENELYSYYRYNLDLYLKQLLHLNELNNVLKQYNNNPKTGVYKEISYLNLDNIFIRNNVFLERLTNEELKELKELYNQNALEKTRDFVKKTFKKLIIFNIDYSIENAVNYDPLHDGLLTYNNALVIGVYADNQNIITYLKDKEKEYSDILNIPVNIIIWQNEYNQKIKHLENLNLKEEKKELEIIKMYPKYLPIGSVVLLKDGIKKVMISGYCPINMDKKDKIYDYLGCLYPEGILKNDYNILFDHQDIKKIYCLGLIDEEQKEFMQRIDDFINSEDKNATLENLK